MLLNYYSKGKTVLLMKHKLCCGELFPSTLFLLDSWLCTLEYTYFSIVFFFMYKDNVEEYGITDKWVKKMCCLYTTEFYSATKMNEL
jgi:hypothetical protein